MQEMVRVLCTSSNVMYIYMKFRERFSSYRADTSVTGRQTDIHPGENYMSSNPKRGDIMKDKSVSFLLRFCSDAIKIQRPFL